MPVSATNLASFSIPFLYLKSIPVDGMYRRHNFTLACIFLKLSVKSSVLHLSLAYFSKMNLNRPLEDFIKESLRSKRQQRGKSAPRHDRSNVEGKKNAQPTTDVTNKSGDATTPSVNAPASKPGNNNAARSAAEDGIHRPAGGIAKRRRLRKRRSAPASTTMPRGGSGTGGIAPNINTGPAAVSPPNVSPDNDPSRSDPSYAHPSYAHPGNPPEPQYSPSPQRDYTGSPRGRGVVVAVSNLHSRVTQADITELFETVGPLRFATLIKKRDGSSSGEAEVIFENMHDALEAIKRYNLVPLDNQPLHITLVTNHAVNKTARAGHTRRYSDVAYPAKTDRPIVKDNGGEHFREEDPPSDRRRIDTYSRGPFRGKRFSNNRPGNGAGGDRGSPTKRGRRDYRG